MNINMPFDKDSPKTKGSAYKDRSVKKVKNVRIFSGIDMNG